MRSKVVESFEEAVAGVEDGSSILVAGFGEPGTPHNLVGALYEQGRVRTHTYRERRGHAAR